ncbi:hypothetical protein ACFV3F_42080, partial [Streptomyces sp. NPDC059717]|uniref:hypothetical protein n=1 Tax=Streptomyces sp. NPDC059717 TaxID=3346922 RepID=UPI00369B47F8
RPRRRPPPRGPAPRRSTAAPPPPGGRLSHGTCKAAIFDPRTRTLTGLRRGSVAISVTNGSTRAYTDESSLAPITTSNTIHVVPGSHH